LLNGVLQALPDAVVLFDEAGKVRYANPQAAELVGRGPEALRGLTSAEWRVLLRELFPEAREPDFLTDPGDEPEEVRT
jgi:PAS domain S-box-containing protein